MSRDQIEQAQRLKAAVLAYLNTVADRHYNDLAPLEKNLVDLAQALNTKLDQLIQHVEGMDGQNAGSPDVEERPEDRLGRMLTDLGARIQANGTRMDDKLANNFISVLEEFDESADLFRQARAETVRDRAETAAIRRKMERAK